MNKKILISALITLNLISPVFSQSQPKGADIFIADLNNFKLSGIANITNRDGYDNQPSFSPDGQEILFTSIHEDEQADIYKYSLTENKIYKVTNTSESEYSPIITSDNHLTVVRVEKDSMQRLWQFSSDGSNPELVSTGITNVGYYCWANKSTIAMFILGEHNTLQIFNKDTGKLDIVISDIGRSIHKVPNKNAIKFVHKINDKNWQIKELNLDNMRISNSIKVIEHKLFKSEDFTITPDGTLLMGNGSKLFKYKSDKDKNWVEIADLKDSGIREILRLAISPQGNKLAFVSNIP